MKCSFSRLLYPKRLEEARDGSYMIALFRPNEKILDAQGNRLNSICLLYTSPSPRDTR